MPQIVWNNPWDGETDEGVASPVNILCPRLIRELCGFLSPICTSGALSEQNKLATATFPMLTFLERFPCDHVYATIFVALARTLNESFSASTSDILHPERNLSVYVLQNRPTKNKGTALKIFLDCLPCQPLEKALGPYGALQTRHKVRKVNMLYTQPVVTLLLYDQQRLQRKRRTGLRIYSVYPQDAARR